MAFCDFCDSCFFFNERLLDVVLNNTEEQRGKYCVVNFSECAIYKLAKSYGVEKVPGYICPDGSTVNLNTPTFAPRGSYDHRENEMFIKVIFPDGTSGKVRSSFLGSMTQLGSVVAFRCSEGWVEIRRMKGSDTYRGPDRRMTIPFT